MIVMSSRNVKLLFLLAFSPFFLFLSEAEAATTIATRSLVGPGVATIIWKGTSCNGSSVADIVVDKKRRLRDKGSGHLSTKISKGKHVFVLKLVNPYSNRKCRRKLALLSAKVKLDKPIKLYRGKGGLG